MTKQFKVATAQGDWTDSEKATILLQSLEKHFEIRFGNQNLQQVTQINEQHMLGEFLYSIMLNFFDVYVYALINQQQRTCPLVNGSGLCSCSFWF